MEAARKPTSTNSPVPVGGRREIAPARGTKRPCSPDNSAEHSHHKKAAREPAEIRAHPQLEQKKLSQQSQFLKARNDRILGNLQREVSTGDASSKFIVGRKIGQGSFGKVYRGSTRDGKQQVAFKVQYITPGNIRPQLVSELTILKNVQHDNITRYIDSYIIKDELWIMMEYVDGLSVDKLCAFHRRNDTEMERKVLASIVRGIVRALEFLHGMDMMHRDVKGENVLLGKSGSVKLGDFGLSTREGLNYDVCGTVPYMAPELVKRSRYTKSVDIWALGMTVVEMLNNSQPYSEEEYKDDIKENILQHIMPCIIDEEHVDATVMHFLGLCLKPDFRKRATAEFLSVHALTVCGMSAKQLGRYITDVKELL
jgi:p21-activated kinase 1